MKVLDQIKPEGIKTWKSTYKITLGNLNLYREKLNRILTKERPSVPKDRDFLGEWKEWDYKVRALRSLIIESIRE